MIGHDRALVEPGGGGELDELAEVDDRDPVRHVAHDAEVVGDNGAAIPVDGGWTAP
jgi:hypothetical protein